MGWKYDGAERPPFAEAPERDQESVWDYPRPPMIKPDSRLVSVRFGEILIAESCRSLRVLETASPPTLYLPPDDVRMDLLQGGEGASFCEWKGRAHYYDFATGRIQRVGWSYAQPTPGFERLANYVAFYPGKLECFVDGERVRPQPGGFYGGWMTAEIVGPVKGTAGTQGW